MLTIQPLTTVVAMILCSLAAQPIGAQTPDPSPPKAAMSFSELAKLLKPGTVIDITDASGRRTSGRLGQLSTSSLELLGTRREIDDLSATPIPVSRRFSETDVQSIDVRRDDSVINGTLIGLTLGGIAGVVAGAANCRQDSCAAAPVAALFGGLFGGIGAGVGLLTDALINQRTRVYTSGQRQANIRVSPVLSRTGGGAIVSVRF